jgi:hypothetical protein
MSKQSMPGDKSGWKRGAGAYSKSYADLDHYGTPDSKVSRESDINRGSGNGGYASALPKPKRDKGGGSY